MEVIKDLWKDKPLFITVLVGVAIVVIILIRNSQKNLQASTQANATTPAVSGGYPGTFIEYSYYNNQPVSNAPAPVTAPTIATATTAVQNNPITLPPITNVLPVATPVIANNPTVQLPTNNTPAIPQTQSYTVVPGDTLSGIAARLGTTWQALFNKNQNVITQVAAQHGNPIGGGPWNNIFPGEVIQY